LEQSHRANRERYEACLEELRLSARAHIDGLTRARRSSEAIPASATQH